MKIAIVPRKVTWELGIQDSARSRSGRGKELEQSTVTGLQQYKTAISVGKIIVLIQTQDLDRKRQGTIKISELRLGDSRQVNMGAGLRTLIKKKT